MAATCKGWIVALGVAAALLAGCGGGGGDDDARPGPSGAATLGRDGGKVVAGSAEVVVPPGAMDQETTIRVAADSSGSPPLPNWVRAAGDMLKITPHGGRFAEPVTVRLRAPSVTLAANERLYIAKADPGGEWQVFSETEQRDGWLEVQVSSFSYVVPVVVPFTTSTASGLPNPAPFALTPLVLSCDGQPCANPERLRTMTLTIATSGNGGQVPQNCVNPKIRLLYVNLTGSNQGIGIGNLYPVTPALAIRHDLAFPLNLSGLTGGSGRPGIIVLARLQCTDPATNTTTSDLTMGSARVYVDSFSNRTPWVLEFPTAPSAAEGEQVTLRALLNGGGSRPPNSGGQQAAPTAADQATVYLERLGAGQLGWVTAATVQQTAANPRPYAGNPPWRYWSIDYPLGTVGLADNGSQYRVRACYQSASGATQCSLSQVATLNVRRVSEPPRFDQQPASVLVKAGQTASLSARVSGIPAPTLQWQTRPPGSTGSWFDVTAGSGGTTANYTTAVLQEADNGRQYRLAAYQLRQPFYSSAVTVSVSDGVVAPTITSQPTPLTVVDGSEAVFAVAASGTAPLSYQWYIGNSMIPFANGAQLRFPRVSSGNAAEYKVRVSNTAGSVLSNAARLTVTSTPNPPAVVPSIVTQPAAVAVGEGNTATFAVGVAGSGPLTFQWRRNGTAIAGATAAAYTIAAVAAADAGNYSVVVGNGAGSVTSQAATLAIVPNGGGGTPTAPTIIAEPSSVVVAPGMGAAFGVTVQGSGPLSYRWLRNDVELPGQTTAVVTIAAASSLDAGSYRVEVSNAAGTATSATSQLILLGAPVIVTQPAAASVPEGDKATFFIAATGDALRFQWTRNGVAIDGATGFIYTTPALALADGGAVYAVVAYNGAGAVFSSGALLSVTAAPPPPPPVVQVNRIGAGFRHTCAVKADGDAACWGYNSSGQVGAGNYGSWPSPRAWTAVPEDIASVAAGDSSSCALTTSGKVWCAGGIVAIQNLPVQVAGIDGALQLGVGSGFACFVAADRTAWCWGSGGTGQLGNGSNGFSAVPVQVQRADGSPLTGVASIDVGANVSCAVLTGGSVACWGANNLLQAGSPSGTDTSRANLVAGVVDAVGVAAGESHACAVFGDGTVRCWGDNSAAQFGNGTTSPMPTATPTAVLGVADASAIASGSRHMCAIRTEGSVSCWGTAPMGNGGVTEVRASPQYVGELTSSVVALAAGFEHTCALRDTGKLYCWGGGSEGQLGQGDTAPRLVPTELFGVDFLAP